MENKELLYYFKQAKEDWERSRWKRYLFGQRRTEAGLCYYFCNEHNIRVSSYKMDKLRDCWIKYSTKYVGVYHFNTREERIHAINMVIKDLKQQDNGQ